jgi:hypothetical protein
LESASYDGRYWTRTSDVKRLVEIKSEKRGISLVEVVAFNGSGDDVRHLRSLAH